MKRVGVHKPQVVFSRAYGWWGKKDDDDKEDEDKKGEFEDDTPPVQNTNPTSAAVTRSGGEYAPIVPTVVALPIKRRPLFPGEFLQLNIDDEPTSAALQAMYKKGPSYVGTFLSKQLDDDVGTSNTDAFIPVSPVILSNLDEVHSIGSFAQIMQMSKPATGGLQMLLVAHRRLQVYSCKLSHMVPLIPYNLHELLSACLTATS